MKLYQEIWTTTWHFPVLSAMLMDSCYRWPYFEVILLSLMYSGVRWSLSESMLNLHCRMEHKKWCRGEVNRQGLRAGTGSWLKWLALGYSPYLFASQSSQMQNKYIPLDGLKIPLNLDSTNFVILKNSTKF